MRLLIVGTLKGQLTTATKLAMDKGASVTHAVDIDQALNCIKTAPKIIVLPARTAQEAREMLKLRSLEPRGVCPVPKQNRVDRTDAIDADLTVLFDGTPFRYRICPDVPEWKADVVDEDLMVKYFRHFVSHR